MNPASSAPALPLAAVRHVDGVAHLTIDNPPINAFNARVRTALQQALLDAERDDAVRAVVIGAAGKLFSGGGDLRELGKPEPPDAPGMTALALQVEGFPKPVVVAMAGRAIGGGVLLALACHARIGTPRASIALPEVRLGFAPGAGGTQRLPRLIGLARALDMVVRARAMEANEAAAAGFFDALADEATLLEAASARALAIADGHLPWRRTASLPVPAMDDPPPDALRETFRAVAAEVFPGREAPLTAIDLILGAAQSAFAEGAAREREQFLRLSNSTQTRALLHLFFAERALDRPDPVLTAGDGRGTVRALVHPDGRVTELICAGSVTPAALAAAIDAVKRERRLPVPVRDGSVVERLLAASEGVADGQRRDAIIAAARGCLAEGMVARPSDIDIIAVEACGYPQLEGGPLFSSSAP